nr:integrase, catalytic region, zinc finger, CCHC-type, peptidase aspartic, catalytic [Tanacetum cinerariifolium]
SKPTCNKKNDKISQTPSRNIKNKVEDQPRKVNKKNRVVEPICNVDVKQSQLNTNSELICAICSSKKAKIVESKNAKNSKPNHTWGSNATDIPSSFTFVMTGCSDCSLSLDTREQSEQPVMTRVKDDGISVALDPQVVQIVLWYLDSGCSKHMTRKHSQLMNFVSKVLGTIRFENNHIARIMRYGDYQLGNVTISRVYYVKGLGHNLFSVG